MFVPRGGGVGAASKLVYKPSYIAVSKWKKSFGTNHPIH